MNIPEPRSQKEGTSLLAIICIGVIGFGIIAVFEFLGKSLGKFIKPVNTNSVN